MGRAKKSRQCPRCASKDVLLQDSFDDGADLYVCADCDHEFEIGRSRNRRRDADHDSGGQSKRELTDDEWRG